MKWREGGKEGVYLFISELISFEALDPILVLLLLVASLLEEIKIPRVIFTTLHLLYIPTLCRLPQL
jgi:hypothetical protein